MGIKFCDFTLPLEKWNSFPRSFLKIFFCGARVDDKCSDDLRGGLLERGFLNGGKQKSAYFLVLLMPLAETIKELVSFILEGVDLLDHTSFFSLYCSQTLET